MMIWELETKHIILDVKRAEDKFRFFDFANVSFSPDNRYVATADDSGASLWDMAWWTQNENHLIWHASSHKGGYVNEVKFSPDGRVLLLVGRGGITILNSSNGAELFWKDILVHEDTIWNEINGIAISRDGRLVVTAADSGMIGFWALNISNR